MCMTKTSCWFGDLWRRCRGQLLFRGMLSFLQEQLHVCLEWKAVSWLVETSFPFFFFSKGTNQEPGFQSRFVFCYSNRRITRLHSICCWTASVRAPSVNVLFLLCVKTLIKYKYTAECTVCCKCQGVFQVFYTCCVHKISTKLKVMWIKSVPLAEHSGETWDLIWWDWF